ncbi:hypothetical protein [Stenotrophomonas sp. GD04024]|uniref:hypothetical protein n=1 Tax=Stenotrophomonas TaxID=40323 RepID=UPI00244C5DB0|nr:hypothetical protein [Stenotrophomonas sp. GD04024]MDG9988956.1 hypothetical protein [Stenotrophomonas sp. GD04024]
MPDVKLSQLAAASAASVAAGAGLWTMAGHILGLQMEYVGPASIRVSSGSAWIPSLQRAIEVPSALTLSGLTLAANTWYHLYLYLNGSTPAIEAVTDAPAAPYSGTARAKTGATSRRYLGSFKTSASGAIMNFRHGQNNFVAYLEAQGAAPTRVLNGGVATAETQVSLAGVIPISATQAQIRILNFVTAPPGAYMLSGTPDDSASGPPLSGLSAVDPTRDAYLLHSTDSSQRMTYWFAQAPTSGAGYIDVYGYFYDR